MAQAVIRSIAVNAAKGSQRAQRLLTTLIATTERTKRGIREAELEGAVTYKITWERELERRQKLGIIAPDPLPHPDHILIDVAKGTVRIAGPATKEEKALWDTWTEQRTIFGNELRELKNYIEDPKATEREEAMEDIAKVTQCLEIIRLALEGSRPALRLLGEVSDRVQIEELGT